MSIIEGRSTTMACRTDETELAVIDTSGRDAEQVTAISGRLLRARAGGQAIAADGLPFEIRLV